MTLLERRSRWDARANADGAPTISLLSTFVIDPLAPYLGTELQDRNARFDIVVGPFGQIAQECLAPDSKTARATPSVLVVWPRFEDLWAARPLPLDASDGDYAHDLVALADVAISAAKRWNATLVFVLPHLPDRLPVGVGDLRNRYGVIETAHDARSRTAERLRAAGAWIADADRFVRAVGAKRAFDARLDTLARIPFTQELYAEAGETIARIVTASIGPARKVVVVDGDNTLWGGVIGETGWEHVELSDNTAGEAFRNFQSHLLDLRRAGWLLALCSKNHDDDIVQVFSRGEMRLSLDHLATRRVGWDSKATSLLSIAEELGLGVDSLVFIDDNPHEIAEVTARLPSVLCIRMPADAVHWRAALDKSGAFDRAPPTAEDRVRADQYAEEKNRGTARENFASTADYLADLKLEVRVFPPREEHISRLAQLVVKTNQFNLNGKRRTEPELRALVASETHLILMAEARDRFGDYGQIGVVIAEQSGTTADLDTFLLSCRVLGRGVEDAVLATTCRLLRERGASTLFATLRETPRNEPARTFFAAHGGQTDQRREVSAVAFPSHINLVP